MARSMRLFLVRHGETVDNVAQLYAGSRDSALTNHGYQQAMRLGLHFKGLGLTFTHLFSSHLQRAVQTAGLIKEAQSAPNDDTKHMRQVPELEQLRILMEQDFGDLEGKKWTDIQTGLQSKPGFTAVETKEAMGRRADIFLDKHLLPLLDKTTDGSDFTVAIVSHGIFLSTLWKRLLRRLPAKSLCLRPDLQLTARPSLEHLGGWSNTGYLELLMVQNETEKSAFVADAAVSSSSMAYIPSTIAGPGDVGAVELPGSGIQPGEHAAGDPTAPVVDGTNTRDFTPTSTPAEPIASHMSGLHIAHGWSTTILMINCKDHLKGLKRTGGGVGSSRHDPSQQSIESFFKRRRVD
ncbi:phosphoglycerate mutase family protein [Stagonosporopsis vannaccii]|nr:phosphoglycerate mutase family protein [Stagonosporopsis vannaccii]